MKKEVSPALVAVVIVILIVAIVFFYWRGTAPEGVRTPKPPPPNPPSGIPVPTE